MIKDDLPEQWRTSEYKPQDVNSDRGSTKPPQSYDSSEMSKDTGSTNPKKVVRQG